MTSDFIISFDSPHLGYGHVSLNNPHRSGLPAGVTVIVGPNGSGKTTLGTILEKGRYAYGNRLTFAPGITNVKMLRFTDIHTLTGIDVHYYNQRLEATANEYVPSVEEIFKDKLYSSLYGTLSEIFSLHNVSDKKINYLSSGELRKLLIINALLAHPHLLILDNPYIGLDSDSRIELDNAIRYLQKEGLSVALLLCDYQDIPSYTDSIIEINNTTIGYPISGNKEISLYVEQRQPIKSLSLKDNLPEIIPLRYVDSDMVFSITEGHARYGEKIIFENFNWKIRKGECWALTGANGSGKSLLLSMVCADNPQGYANDIILFDRKRGSGESIWEIKDAIGYVCPEMQLYFRSNSPVKEIIIQGMRNSLNRYQPSNPKERAIADEWMELLGISHLADRHFSALSSGEQRMVLVARALIKQPDLLVLDEPLHGLDAQHKTRVLSVISALTQRNGSSLIFVSHYESEIPDCVRFRKSMK